jgi:16S rRNA (guanine527-N7)-methyltransferase
VTASDELESGATALGVELQPAQVERLLQFAALLRRWNGAFNLVSRRDAPRLVARHLLDALSLAPMLQGARVLDLGTGAGLPGVPLAIANPDKAFTLIDRSERRIRFVRQATIDLGLSNVTPIAADFADFRADGLFDTVVSRAVAKPAALWRVAADLLAPGGIVLFQVGESELQIANLEADARSLSIRIPGLTQLHHVLRMSRRSTAPNGPIKDAER